MKKSGLFTAFFTLSLLAAPLHAEKTPTAKDYFQAGQAAIRKGNAEDARKYLSAAVQLAPNNGNYKAALLDLDQKKTSMIKVKKKNQLAALNIPKIDVEDAPLSDALDALSIIIENTHGSENVPNFVVTDPTNSLRNQLVTLNVTGIPANAVLDMLLSQARGKAAYTEHAIIITPR